MFCSASGQFAVIFSAACFISVCQLFCSPLSFRNFTVSISQFARFVDISFLGNLMSLVFYSEFQNSERWYSAIPFIHISHYFQALCKLFSVTIRNKFKVSLLLVTFCSGLQYILIFHWKGLVLAYGFSNSYIGGKWELEFNFKEQDCF